MSQTDLRITGKIPRSVIREILPVIYVMFANRFYKLMHLTRQFVESAKLLTRNILFFDKFVNLHYSDDGIL